MGFLYKILIIFVTVVLVQFGSLKYSCEASEKWPNNFEGPAVDIDRGVTMRVLWTVSAYHVGKNAEWGETEARGLLFKPLDVTSSTIVFDGQTCNDVTFTSEIVDAPNYLMEQHNIIPQALSFEEETMEVIKTDCLLPGFGEYMRLTDRRLIIAMHGVLFVFEPTVNY